MGLIDVLTQYDTKKKAAHAAKTVKHGVSCTGEEGRRWRAAVGWLKTLSCNCGGGADVRCLLSRHVMKCTLCADDADVLFLLFVSVSSVSLTGRG